MFGRRSPVLDVCEDTIEDEESPLLGDRLLPALALADRLARYGGLFVVLIHAEITDHKLRFEKALVEALRQRAWFGTLREFGEFWAARDKASVDVERQGGGVRVCVAATEAIHGLALRLPPGYRVVSVEPSGLIVTQQPGQVVFGDLRGSATLMLEDGSGRR